MNCPCPQKTGCNRGCPDCGQHSGCHGLGHEVECDCCVCAAREIEILSKTAHSDRLERDEALDLCVYLRQAIYERDGR
jgi:hypothetical protein